MSPILTGVIASGISGHLTPPWEPEGAYDILATVELASNVYSMNVPIPAGYKNIIIRGWNISDGNNNAIGVRFNNDSTTNYWWQAVDASGGTTPSGFTAGNTSYAGMGYTGTATYSAPFVTQINDVDSTNKYKTMFTYFSNQANNTTASYLGTMASVWQGLDPINHLTIFHGNAVKVFTTGTTFNIYGVK